MKSALILTKSFGNANITLQQVEGNLFKITTDSGTFTNGRQVVYSDGSEIGHARIEGGNTLFITKQQMKRIETIRTYHNGEIITPMLFSEWSDVKGNGLHFQSQDDFYYYFNRPDCGIILNERTTIFHKKIGVLGVISK